MSSSCRKGFIIKGFILEHIVKACVSERDLTASDLPQLK